jgi:hypothetical protein
VLFDVGLVTLFNLAPLAVLLLAAVCVGLVLDLMIVAVLATEDSIDSFMPGLMVGEGVGTTVFLTWAGTVGLGGAGGVGGVDPDATAIELANGPSNVNNLYFILSPPLIFQDSTPNWSNKVKIALSQTNNCAFNLDPSS